MDNSINALAAALMEARDAKAKAEEVAKEAGRVVRDAEAALFAAMVDAELERVTANGYTFSLDTKTYYSCPAENTDALHEVMVTLGRGDIFKYSVHYQTLNATIRELVDQRGELPESVAALVKAFDDGKVSVRKAPAARKG